MFINQNDIFFIYKTLNFNEFMKKIINYKMND